MTRPPSRRRDLALMLAIAFGVLIGLALEKPITEAFRAAVTPVQAQATQITGTASVIDGDTLEIRGQRIRLHGIDAPERGQTCKNAGGQTYRCGQVAALALSDRIGRAPVRCAQTETDRYGRAIAICVQNGVNLNAWMVRAGHAVAYRRYAIDYVGEEGVARAAGRGLWAGTFDMPWDWRTVPRTGSAWPSAQSLPPSGCEIKGNINGSGTRIYHLPGQQHYDRTRINTARGERWFCSEDDARQAGWRRAKQ